MLSDIGPSRVRIWRHRRGSGLLGHATDAESAPPLFDLAPRLLLILSDAPFVCVHVFPFMRLPGKLCMLLDSEWTDYLGSQPVLLCRQAPVLEG